MTQKGEQRWALLTNHAHVLLRIAENPDIRLRDLAAGCHITERAAQRIVSELEESGFLSHERVGRRNHYSVDESRRSLHPLETHLGVLQLACLSSQHGSGVSAR